MVNKADTVALRGKELVPGLCLFIAALAIGCFVCKDYGVSWDEPVQRELGQVTYNYVFSGDSALKTYQFRGLGSGFELPLACIEKWFLPDDAGTVYFARHLITHVFFLVAALCGYVLILRLFRNQFWACLGFILLVFHPRIYAHSFFNSKDIPFLSAFLIALLVAEVAFRRDKWYWYAILGLASGYATSIRAMGLILPACFLLFFAADCFRRISRKEHIGSLARNCILLVVAYSLCLYIAWPILWSAPAHYFIDSIHGLANIHWEGKVLFGGKFYYSDQLPWSYLPVWFSITMPELLLVAGIAGILLIIVLAVRHPDRYILNGPGRNFLLYFICFLLPAAAMVLFHGANIDDWRHLYFIYPCFVLLALFAANKVRGRKLQLVIKCLFAVQIFIAGFFVVKNHPFEQVYFNNLVSHGGEYLRNNYDLDYWGCGFRQGLEHLSKSVQGELKLCANIDILLDNNISTLGSDEQARIEHVTKRDADYLITNFRMHPFDYPYNEVYSVKVLNSRVLAVYKLEQDSIKKKELSAKEIASLQQYLLKKPEDDYAHGTLAELFIADRQLDSAEAHLQTVFVLNPDNPVAANGLAKIYVLEKKYTKAIDIFRKAAAIKPDEWPVMNIGSCHYYLGHYDSAIYYWKKVLTLDKMSLKAVENIATTYKYVGNTDSAAIYAEIARKFDPAFKL